MLTPEAQLMAAYQAAQQPQIPLTYNTANEETGMGLTASGIAAGTTAANFAAGAPSMLLPMLMGAPLISKLAGSALGTGRIGRAVGGAFSPISALLNPFGFGQKAFSAAKAAGMGMAGAGTVGALAALPGLGLVFGGGAAIDYASKQVFQGAQDYVATRQLMREMPGVGFGATSVLGGGSGLTDLSAGQISQANQSIQSIGGRHGLDASASRNLLSNLSQTGMIDTSSVKAMSQSYQKALSDFKLMAKTLQIDIDQTIELYKGLDQLGLRGNAERKSVLSRASATSSLTGKSFDSVMQTVTGAVAAGNSLGLSSYASANVATRAMAVSALAEKSGALPESYLNRVGGYDGYTNRMIELELGMSRSSGAMRMMANMYDTGGRFRSDNSLSAGGAGRSANSFFRNVDPYELDRMSQEMSSALPSMVLARVDAIQARHGSGSVRANREQHRFMQTMGIEDPQEQLAFLMSARSAGAGQFVQGLQASTDRVNAAPLAAAEALRRESLGLKDALKLMTSSLTTELRAFGEAMQVASEEAAGRIAMSRGGQRFSPANFQSTTQQLGVVSEYIRQGKLDPFTSDPMREVMGIEGRYRDLIANGLSSSSAFTGITRAEGRGMLTGGLDRTIARFGYDLPEQLQNMASTVNRAALSTVFGEDVFRPRQSENDVMGGFYAGRNETGGAYSIRSGNNPNRGQVTFGQIMESVANMHGQNYDSRTNRVLRRTAQGERQFRNQYGDSLTDAMTQFRGDVSQSFRSQMGDTVMGESFNSWAAMTGGATAGALAGMVFGPLGIVGGALTGAGLGFAGYAAMGGLSGTIRSARENIFGETGAAPRMLGSDVQQMLSTSQGSLATRNYLSSRVFGQNYNQLSQSQRMYFDNYMRTNEEASDFSGIVAPEVAPLNEYEMATLALNVTQEGLVRNLFTTTLDQGAAASRRDAFSNAAQYAGEQETTERLAQYSAAVAEDRHRRLSAGRMARNERRLQASNRMAEAGAAIDEALGLMNPEERERYRTSSYAERQQMLQEAANREADILESRIAVRGIDAATQSEGYTATAGAMLAVVRAGGQNNEEAMRLALARTTQMGDLNLDNMFSITSDRSTFISETNQVSREASPYLLALQRSRAEGVEPVDIITNSLVARGVPASQARERARQIERSGRQAVAGMSQETITAITGGIGGGVNLPSEADLERALAGEEEVVAARAQMQYAAAFDEASSQNLDVLRQQRAGDFMRSEYGQRMNFRGRSGAEVFSEMTPEEIEQMNSDLNDLRGEITRAEVAGADPEERRRLQQRAAQLEEYINLSGQGDSTNRLVRMAAGSLFVNGEFQGGNVATVVGQMGFSGASGALNQLAALTDERSTGRTKRAAFANLVGDSPEQQAAFAERLGLDAGATMDQMRTVFDRRSNTPGDTLLQDLVQDLLKSTGVDVSDEADTALQRDAYTAMIGMAENLANSVTSSSGRSAIRVLSATNVTADDNVNTSGG
jgi:hypothetical protein